ncbi:MAG: NADH-quinone oxidoreductase subunit M [Bacteroidales bacterium]|nr:NADH-quinone oxidoreductase subunit M [Bacteroidales bacterium]
MILPALIWILLISGAVAWLAGKKFPAISRYISLFAVILNLFLIIRLWIRSGIVEPMALQEWIATYERLWISTFGIHFQLGLDGISLLLLALTYFLGALAVLVSWSQIKKRVGFFHFNVLWILAGISGVFLSMDLFLFYFAWEVMLIPMYFIILVWGYENRVYASMKFFIFTQASGLFMFLSILGLYFMHGSQTGTYTFNYFSLKETVFTTSTGWLLMSGFLIAFLVKLPALPFHTWLPDAHTEAPTAGSVILAGLMLKTGAYGIFRFVIPIFHELTIDLSPYAMYFGAAAVLYGAKLSFAQTDLKRMVAYSSVSHMGFVLLGLFALNEVATQGVIIQLIAHGLSTGALFFLAGMLQERTHTREIGYYGGLWSKMPKAGAMMLVFAMASLGLPGLANFIAEFLVLLGSFKTNAPATIIATIGLVVATVYSLKLFQAVFHGEMKNNMVIKDLNSRELSMMLVMVSVICWIGLSPEYPVKYIPLASSKTNGKFWIL